jgi:hypothetical protein
MKVRCESPAIRANPDDVFAHLLRLERYDRWLAGCTSSVPGDDIDGHPTRRLEFSLGTFSDAETFRLADVDSTGRTVRLVKARPGPALEATMAVRGGSRTKISVTLEHSWTGRVLGVPIGGPLFRITLGGLLKQSASRLERDLRSHDQEPLGGSAGSPPPDLDGPR